MHYYQHNIGDYRRDTAHLSLLEHGIYRQLLDQYYLNEGPLVDDETRLMRSLCVRTADEMQAFQNVCSDFFERVDGSLVHKRCEQEIGAIFSKSDKARESANARWARARENEMRTHSDRNANGMLPNNPIPNNPIPNKPPKSPKGDTPNHPVFDEIWAVIPKRPGDTRTAALKAFNSRLKQGKDPDLILAGVKAYAKHCEAQRSAEPGWNYQKSAKTFLGPDLFFEADWPVVVRMQSEAEEERWLWGAI